MKEYPVIPAQSGWYLVRVARALGGDRAGEKIELFRVAVVAWEMRPDGATPIAEISSNDVVEGYWQGREVWIVVDPQGRASWEGGDYASFEACLEAADVPENE